MKAEERHKLEKNVLADWLGQTITDIKPYSRTIVTGLVVLVAIVGVAIAWPRFRDRASTSAWEALYNAMAADNYAEMERIAEEHPKTAVAHWALVVAADARLAGACMQLFNDKASAAQDLRRAIEDYTTVIDEASEPELRQRALFGRARAYEAISGSRQGEGEIPKAIADYEQLVENWPTGSYTPLATEQIKRLKSQDTKVFYDKFAAFTPKRPVSKELDPGGRQLPFDPSSLPDDSPSEFSKLLNLGDLKVQGAKTDEKADSEKTPPGKAAPAKTEPAKAEPPKGEMAKPGAAKPAPPEPQKPAPPKVEPQKPPAKTEPAKK